MWTTENYCGEKVVWYSEEEYNKLKKENENMLTEINCFWGECKQLDQVVSIMGKSFDYWKNLKSENEKLKEQIIKAITNAQNFKDLYFLEKQKIEKIEKIASPHCSQCNEILKIIKGEAMSDFYSTQEIKSARKEHTCECCNTKIQVGEAYEIHTGKYEGNFFTFKICPVCTKILDYWCYDLGYNEFNLNELIGELWQDEKVYNLLKEIKHPSKFVMDTIESYEELQEERKAI